MNRSINERPGKMTLFLVPNSRVLLSSTSEERLESRFRILQRLWDHPREAYTNAKSLAGN